MKNFIYHNPRCSKSREAVKILQERNIHVDIVEYLKDPPTVDELSEVCALLNCHPTEIIRTKDPVFKQMKLSLSDDRSEAQWIQILVENPVLLQRPILVYNGKAVICRPADNLIHIIT